MSNTKTIQQRASDFFPHEESIVDVSGIKRKFVIAVRELAEGGGYVVTASEYKVENGYEFESYSETNPFNALATVRSKMKYGLSTKYLAIEKDRDSLRFNEFKGRISYGGVVIDGKFKSFNELCEILQVYEGFSLNVSIVDSTS